MNSNYVFVNSNVETVKDQFSDEYEYQYSESSSENEENSLYSPNRDLRSDDLLDFGDSEDSEYELEDSNLINLDSAKTSSRAFGYEKPRLDQPQFQKNLFRNPSSFSSVSPIQNQNLKESKIPNNYHSSNINPLSGPQADYKNAKSVRFSRGPDEDIPNDLDLQYSRTAGSKRDSSSFGFPLEVPDSEDYSTRSYSSSSSSNQPTQTSTNFNDSLPDSNEPLLANGLSKEYVKTSIMESLVDRNTKLNSRSNSQKLENLDLVAQTQNPSFYDLLKGSSGIFSYPNRFFLSALKPIYSGGSLFRWASLPSMHIVSAPNLSILPHSSSSSSSSNNAPNISLRKSSQSVFSQPLPSTTTTTTTQPTLPNPNPVPTRTGTDQSNELVVGSNAPIFLSEPDLPHSVFYLPSGRNQNYSLHRSTYDYDYDYDREYNNSFSQAPAITSGGKSLQLSKQITLSKFDKRIVL
ncbi:hypothetical protein AYI68_g2876 [Smittium mucronatum]|uniref:Uncharacterized protein n=1 Tax=Smittium mucronatum TaxID=133383 RepID=A0A1R0H1H8_9FUNG|nr:hypothetical protein AYI68_g2876 [Smittium mucronatum]